MKFSTRRQDNEKREISKMGKAIIKRTNSCELWQLPRPLLYVQDAELQTNPM